MEKQVLLQIRLFRFSVLVFNDVPCGGANLTIYLDSFFVLYVMFQLAFQQGVNNFI